MKIDKEIIRKYIGAQLRCLRIDAGMSIGEVSHISGYNKSNICNVENGKYTPGVDIVTNLAKFYGGEIHIDPSRIEWAVAQAQQIIDKCAPILHDAVVDNEYHPVVDKEDDIANWCYNYADDDVRGDLDAIYFDLGDNETLDTQFALQYADEQLYEYQQSILNNNAMS